MEVVIPIQDQKHKILNEKDEIVFDSTTKNKWSPEDYVSYESFFNAEEYIKLKIFVEHSGQAIEIIPEKMLLLCCIPLAK